MGADADQGARSGAPLRAQEQLRLHFRAKMMLIWDRAQIHRSRRVRPNLENHADRFAIAYLPTCAPELNPVE